MGKRRGWGRLRKLPSGRWQASYTGPDLGVHKAVTTFPAAIDAEGWLTDERRLIDAGKWTPPATRNRQTAPVVPTFREYAETWLKLRRSSGRIQPRTAQHYASVLENHLLPVMGDKVVTAITTADVKRWYAGLTTGPTAKANAYLLVHTIMAEAVDDGLIAVQPVRIKGAGSKKRERELRVLTVAELDAITATIEPRFSALVLLGGWCALRFGELAGLRRCDLDLKGGMVHVRHAAIYLRDGAYLGPPKTDASRRDVTIPPHIVPALKAHLAEHAAFGKEGLVFPAANGRTITPYSTVRRAFKPAAAEAGRPDVRLHDLRHFGAIQAARAGATVGELQQRLGHTTAQAAMIYQSAVSERGTQIATNLSGLAGDTSH